MSAWVVLAIVGLILVGAEVGIWVGIIKSRLLTAAHEEREREDRMKRMKRLCKR